MKQLMGRRRASALALAGLAATAAGRADAVPKSGYEFGYFLARTSFGAAAAERLVKCPTADDEDAVIETTVVISSAVRPDPDAYVRLDTSSGFLAKRTTEIKLNPDGTLVSFNGSTEGEGSEVAGAVIKVATTVAAAMVGVPLVGLAEKMDKSQPAFPLARLSFSCTPQTKAKVDRRDGLAADVARLEALVTTGQGNAAVAALLDARRAALADADDALTVTSKVVVDPRYGTLAGKALIQPFDPDHWFQGTVPDKIARRPGINGFELNWAANKPIADAFGRSSGRTDVPADPQPYLLYRRPVPVAVKVSSCQTAMANCVPDGSDDAVTAAKQIYVAQLSPIFTIPLGRGGLFGSRQAEADFDGAGTPTRLKYGSTAGGAGIASVVNAAGDGFTTLRGAAAANRDRELQLLRDKKEYRDLMAALNGTQ